MNYELIAKCVRCPVENVREGWPLIETSLRSLGVYSDRCAVAALATVAVETARTFKPVRERGGHAYLDKYDTGRLAERLGNTPEDDDDGQRYCGRGYVQITGRGNYLYYGMALGADLVANPDLALEPHCAAAILAAFFKSVGVRSAADRDDWSRVRRKVNGGLNGYKEFKECVDRLLAEWPAITKEESNG